MQNIYFHSAIADDQVAVIFEIVGTTTGDLDDNNAIGLGWGFLRPFLGDNKLADLSSSSEVTSRLVIATNKLK